MTPAPVQPPNESLWSLICAYSKAVFGSEQLSEPLHALVKERAGPGHGLPQVHRRRGTPALYNVGQAIPTPPFPSTVGDFNRLTITQLDGLAILFNDNFGILETDTLNTAIAKFQAFICGR